MRKILWQAVLVMALAFGAQSDLQAQQVIVGVRTGNVGVIYSPGYRRYWLEYATYPYGYVPYRVGVYVGPRYEPYWGEPYYGFYPYVYPRYIYPVPAVVAPPSRAEYYVVPRSVPAPASNGELVQPRPLVSAERPAEITIVLPAADAQVSVEDYQVRSSGTRRVLQSPPLQPGKIYEYTVTASWKSNGELVQQMRRIAIQAGSRVVIDFTQPEPGNN